MRCKLLFSVGLVVLAVWQSHAEPLQSETLSELLGLLRALDSFDGQAGGDRLLEGVPEVGLSSDSLEKRDLPRLGVSMDRPLPPRGGDRKIMEGPRYRFSFPLRG